MGKKRMGRFGVQFQVVLTMLMFVILLLSSSNVLNSSIEESIITVTSKTAIRNASTFSRMGLAPAFDSGDHDMATSEEGNNHQERVTTRREFEGKFLLGLHGEKRLPNASVLLDPEQSRPTVHHTHFHHEDSDPVISRQKAIDILATAADSPININGNADIATQASINGWPGNGTAANPYVIENLVIVTTLPGTHAIAIRNTDVYLIIRNNTVMATGNAANGEYPAGIYLENVKNAILENNAAFNNSDYGFYLRYSQNNILVNNTAYSSPYGFRLYSSQNNTLSVNTAGNTSRGFKLEYSQSNQLFNNTAINSSIGFTLEYSQNNILVNNTAFQSSQSFYLSSSQNNTLVMNTARYSSQGFSLVSSPSTPSQNNTLVMNTAYHSSLGFYLSSSRNNTLVMNTAYHSVQSFYLSASHDNKLSMNTAINSTKNGFYLSSSQNNTLVMNSAFNSTNNGFYLRYSQNNQLSNNTASQNSGYGFLLDATSSGNVMTHNNLFFNNDNAVQAYSDDDTNIFDYNYWSDHISPDDDNDGIVDTPYLIAGPAGLQDVHPVTSINVMVFDITSPTVSSPPDITYEQGTSGHKISWIVTDSNPAIYVVYQNGTMTANGAWSSGTTITVSVDGLTLGTYNYTIVVIDGGNNQVTDTVFVTVQDTISPIVSAPADLTYEFGSSGNGISWLVIDVNPGTYIVLRNHTSIVANGTWSPESVINITIDGLEVGIYNYTVVVRDIAGNDNADTVIVRVVDTTPPIIFSPDDVNYEEGATNNIISWIAVDAHPGTYQIYRNGSLVSEDKWDSNVTIVINVDGLTIGTYNYTIVVTDVFDNYQSDMVLVTVTPPITPTTTTTPPETTTISSPSSSKDRTDTTDTATSISSSKESTNTETTTLLPTTIVVSSPSFTAVVWLSIVLSIVLQQRYRHTRKERKS